MAERLKRGDLVRVQLRKNWTRYRVRNLQADRVQLTTARLRLDAGWTTRDSLVKILTLPGRSE